MILPSVFLIMTVVQCTISTTLPYSNHSPDVLRNRYCVSLSGCMDYALNVIHGSERYNLFESLWFDAINGTNHSYVITTSDPKNFTELVKKATQLFNTHYLIWKVAPGLNVKVFKKTEDKFGMSVLKDVYPSKMDGRTFGIGRRKIMMVLLPIMYKLGVITTLLMVLTVITLKTLTIGVVLLMLSFGGIITKLKLAHYGPEGYHGPSKDVHVHVHPYPGGSPDHYHGGYSSWHRDSDISHDGTADKTSSSTAPPWSYLPPFMTY